MNINTRNLDFVNFNGSEMNWVKFNGVVIYEAWKKLIASGVPPITLQKCKSGAALNYKIYGNSVQKSILPDEYQQVEYIQTTGTQYIDSGVPLKNGLKTIVDWIYKDADSGNSYTGGHIGSPGNRWLIGSQRQNNVYFFAVGTGNTTTGFKFGNRDVVEAYWESKASYIKVNGVQSTSSFNHLTLTDEPNYTFYMGAVDRGGTATLKPKLTIYNWKFYQDDVLIRDFIPCYRKSDNEIGMYDLVTGTFYTNNGDGTLLKSDSAIINPTPSTPMEIESVGEYDNETDMYNISVKVNDVVTNVYLNEPLRKSGDYADYIDYKNKKIVRLVEQRVLDGSENWEIHTDITGGNVFRLDGVFNPKVNVPLESTFMTHFTVTTTYSTASFEVGVYRFSSTKEDPKITGSRLYVSSDCDTLEEFKEWLSNNKPSIVYTLATPIEETISLPDILLNKDTNIININTTIPSTLIEVEYYGKDGVQLLDETTNNILNDILDGDTETEKDISDAEIEQILNEIIGG